MRSRLCACTTSFFVAGLLTLPALGQTLAQNQSNVPPAPATAPPSSSSQARAPLPPRAGVVNYVEGQASIGGRPINVNSGPAFLQTGQSLTTQNGKAEILLSPGAFLRVDDNSSVRMDSAQLINTTFTVERGRAMVEVMNIHRDDQLTVRMGAGEIHLQQPGLYGFDAGMQQVRVFAGKAEVLEGTRTASVHDGHQVILPASAAANEKLKVHGFDRKAAQSAELFRWSDLRSAYLAQANLDAANSYNPAYSANGAASAYGGALPPSSYGTGWYWNPGYAAYTWLPYDGYYYDPFGWGFFAPGFYGGFGWGFGGYPYGRVIPPRGYPGHIRPGMPSHPIPHGPGSPGGIGFRSGGFQGGGGFHGGGGGFHGGGGGFHGGGGGHR